MGTGEHHVFAKEHCFVGWVHLMVALCWKMAKLSCPLNSTMEVLFNACQSEGNEINSKAWLWRVLQ